jgi:dTDP-4-dehydrorhamnose reductase
MRFAVLGANGQLGRDLCPLLPGTILPLDRAQADLTKPTELTAQLRELRPDVMVNCAAYNFVDRAESEPEAAFAVNTWGVRALAQVCREIGTLLVHFSTDHVFGLDASRRQPLTEDDLPGPVSVYGLSKLSGEYQLRALWDRHLIIRTCGLYGLWGSGGKGGNFVETMLRLGSGAGKSVRVVSDQFCTPTFTQDLARAVVALLEAKAEGLFHVTSAGACSWFEFAGAIFELTGLHPELVPISSQEYNAPARRPAWSVLAGDRLARLGLSPLRPWREALAEYLNLRQRGRA